jgi:uncharacterized protein (TIGR02145 family)
MKIEKILFALIITVITGVSCNKEEKDNFLNPETGTVVDCQGNSYSTVKIGNQWWMAENLKCIQYDTESERQPAAPATEVLIPVSTRGGVNYGPFYIDVRDSITPYSGNLTSEQRSKLGLLYTWAATVGEANANNATGRTTDYTAPRQGICPNGWHVPTDAEWTVLIDYLDGHEKAGKKMKTSAGWYKGENYVAGSNSSGFSVLPAGYDLGTNVGTDIITSATYGIGFDANFWSASANAWYRGFSCNSAEVKRWPYAKFTYFSVRCVKNIEE